MLGLHYNPYLGDAVGDGLLDDHAQPREIGLHVAGAQILGVAAPVDIESKV